MDKQNEKDNTLEFISMYRNHECLWRVQCKDYSNFFSLLKLLPNQAQLHHHEKEALCCNQRAPLDLELNDDRCDSSERASCIRFMQLFHADCHAA